MTPNLGNFCTIALGGLLLYSSWQRPGAIENCTLEEFQNRQCIKGRDGEETVVISVKTHKTAAARSAKLVVDIVQIKKLLQYVDVVRPILDPQGEERSLLIRDGPRPVTQLSRQIQNQHELFLLQKFLCQW